MTLKSQKTRTVLLIGILGLLLISLLNSCSSSGSICQSKLGDDKLGCEELVRARQERIMDRDSIGYGRRNL